MIQHRDAEPRANRTRLGAELRRARRLAGMSGRALAAAVGIGQASVSRIENGQQVPSLPEVDAWAAATKASGEVRTLLGTLTEAALNEVESHRTRLASQGLPTMQTDVAELEARSARIRTFQPTLIPGLLQTAEYARRIFTRIGAVGVDIPGAVAARIERQRILYDEGKRLEFLVTEAALRFRVGPPDVRAAQLDRIATVSTLSNVEIGIISPDVELPTIPWVGFNLLDDVSTGQPLVTIETPHAWLVCRDPDDLTTYRDQFAALREVAVFGDAARAELMRVT